MQLAHNRSKAEAWKGKNTTQSGHFPWWEHVMSDHIHHHVHLKCKWRDRKKAAKNRIEGLRNVVPLDHLNELLHLHNSKKLRLIIIK